MKDQAVTNTVLDSATEQLQAAMTDPIDETNLIEYTGEVLENNHLNNGAVDEPAADFVEDSVDVYQSDDSATRQTVVTKPERKRSSNPVTRLPLPEKTANGSLSAAEPEYKSLLLLLREIELLPLQDKSGVIEISTSNEEIAAMDQLFRSVAGRYKEADYKKLTRAYKLACYAHSRQWRESGEPYILHPIAVARILAELGMDPDTLVAALLHDVAEDTDFTIDYIREQFGESVAKLVDGVTKLKRINELGVARAEQNGGNDPRTESLRKMFLSMADDVRVVLIKLADRLHNMRTLGLKKDEHKRRRTARETLDIYAALANRLGIWSIKSELEDLSFRYLEPATYKELVKAMLQRQPEHEKLLIRAKAELTNRLSEAGIAAQISGRTKHIYSIHKKMKRKNVPFDKIYDILALRVIVETAEQCYAVLGIVHNTWQPIPGEFDDYIALPKDSQYRSLHTSLCTKSGQTLEVQIRTRQMHEEAEYGIAAHWRYKEQGKKHSTDLQKKITWLRQLLDWRREFSNAEEFVDTVKNEALKEPIFVFTPTGEVIDLPAGSTPIDFAYHIHTELGHRCRGATVNGQMTPLDYKLKNGDQVFVITAKRGGPSRDWLNTNLEYTATQRARSKIRQWLRKQARDDNILRGREILDRELNRLSVDKSYEAVCQMFGYEKLDDFLAAIGYGDINTQQIAQRLLDQERSEQKTQSGAGVTISVVGKEGNNFLIQGMGGMLVNIGRCCSPVPGDPVTGYITRGRGIMVHSIHCPNVTNALRKGDEKRFIDVQWASSADQIYNVKIQVQAYDRPGLVRDITSLVADEHVNMTDVSALTGQKNNQALVKATLQIKDTSQLMRILMRIERIPNVLEARRVVS